jgi:hypothetical protein
MPKSFLGAAVLAAAAFVAASVHAQAPTTKKELVARIMQLQQPAVEGMARGLAEQPAAQLMQQAKQVMPRVPAERREALARDIEADLRQYVDEAVPIVSARAVKIAPLTVGPMLEERFTEDELRQVIAMLESPAIRKYQGMAGEMQKTLVERLVSETKAEIEPRVQKLQQSVGKRLGALAKPAGAPAGGSSAPKK